VLPQEQNVLEKMRWGAVQNLAIRMEHVASSKMWMQKHKQTADRQNINKQLTQCNQCMHQLTVTELLDENQDKSLHIFSIKLPKKSLMTSSLVAFFVFFEVIKQPFLHTVVIQLSLLP